MSVQSKGEPEANARRRPRNGRGRASAPIDRVHLVRVTGEVCLELSPSDVPHFESAVL
jgi:hypothetical protein